MKRAGTTWGYFLRCAVAVGVEGVFWSVFPRAIMGSVVWGWSKVQKGVEWGRSCLRRPPADGGPDGVGPPTHESALQSDLNYSLISTWSWLGLICKDGFHGTLLTCRSRKSTDVNKTINDVWITFGCSSFWLLVLCILTHPSLSWVIGKPHMLTWKRAFLIIKCDKRCSRRSHLSRWGYLYQKRVNHWSSFSINTDVNPTLFTTSHAQALFKYHSVLYKVSTMIFAARCHSADWQLV